MFTPGDRVRINSHSTWAYGKTGVVVRTGADPLLGDVVVVRVDDKELALDAGQAERGDLVKI